MWGAIIGDIAGSRFEFNNTKDYNFEIFAEDCFFTDDTIMTIAVARAVMDSNGDCAVLYQKARDYMSHMGKLHYKGVSWGSRFSRWINVPLPYRSYGNGAGMRVSAVGWQANSIEEVKNMSYAVTAVSHNHEEGIKGAEAIAMCIYLARTGHTKDYIKAYMIEHYYPEIADMSYELLHKEYGWVWRGISSEICQGSVPQAIVCFLESQDFESAIRKAISIGGDSDTIGAMTGSIAEAFYGIPDEFKWKSIKYLNRCFVVQIDELICDGYYSKRKQS